MRFERNSLVTVAILILSGCSAGRQARQSDSVYHSPDPVPVPIRHADEFDSDPEHYEYDSAPPRGTSPDQSVRPFPPSAPAREPVPAPPALGVSRVKSVSWLNGNTNESNQSMTPQCGDGWSGKVSRLPSDFYAEGCVTPPAASAPRLECRERTTLMETVQGWRARAKRRRAERLQRSTHCGSQPVYDPGCFAPESCLTQEPDRNSDQKSTQVIRKYFGGATAGTETDAHGNLAEPLRENGWDDSLVPTQPGFTPDEMLDLPSTLVEPPHQSQHPANPNMPQIEALPHPVSPPSAPAEAIRPETPTPPAAPPQQGTPDAVKRIIQPPKWPRLTPPAASQVNLPAASSMIPQDPSLPMIQPGRRI
ncbi:MAG: hypothetical protein KDB01_03465 [Planctomycetaceae bacterium]|nr:hypothetical protein [Planctomycetaceae bacterium]